MRIKRVKLTRFKRFTDLTIADVPEPARLIILAGPNGCGKSSFFDALHACHRLSLVGRGFRWDPDYHPKQAETTPPAWSENVQVEVHGKLPTDLESRKKALYVRSSYRNDPDFNVDALREMGDVLDEYRFYRLIDNDTTVGNNYMRLASQVIEDVFEREDASTTIEEYRKRIVGEIQSSMTRLFPDLVLTGLGNPLVDGTFRFSKGSSRHFHYKNLSGGEKAAFDLLMDMVLKKRTYNDTVFCIDESEGHMNARLQGVLLEELYQTASG